MYSKITPTIVFLSFLLLFSCGRDAEYSSATENIATNNIQYGEKIVDQDGNVYPTIKIGKQTWMAKDLAVTTTTCPNGDSLVFTNGIERGPGVKFMDTMIYRYAYYNNKPDSLTGALYNYKAVRDCQLCPEGYRIPTLADWKELVNTLGGTLVAGEKLKIGGSSGMDMCNCGWLDSYGSVYRGRAGWWWTNELDFTNYKAFTLRLNPNGAIIFRPDIIRYGVAVRCVKEDAN